MIVILFGVLLLAVLADMTRNRIPNALIVIGLSLGIISSLVTNGFPGLITSIRSVIISFLAFYIFYYVKALGAGDIKLLILEALYLGAVDAAKIMSTSFVIGALYGCLKLLYRSILSKIINTKEVALNNKNDNFKFDLQILINTCLFPGIIGSHILEQFKERLAKKKLNRVPFAPFILISTVIVLIFWQT